MTMPAEDTLDREASTLWVTDAELIRRMGVPEKIARETLRMLDAKPTGFPRKQKVWGDRRYWPAVKDYFDATYGTKVSLSTGRPKYETAR
jgi:hypothetical protein